MDVIVPVFSFVYGVVWGSFLNVLVNRGFKGTAKGHSQCPFCAHRLYAKDLVPLISFVVLRGKCAYCKHKISPKYFVGEFYTALMFSLSSLLIYNGYVHWLSVLVVILCTYIGVYEIWHYRLPKKTLVLFSVLALIYAVVQSTVTYVWFIEVGLILCLVFVVNFLVVKDRLFGLFDYILLLSGFLLVIDELVLYVWFSFLMLAALLPIFLLMFSRRHLLKVDKIRLPLSPIFFIAYAFALTSWYMLFRMNI